MSLCRHVSFQFFKASTSSCSTTRVVASHPTFASAAPGSCQREDFSAAARKAPPPGNGSSSTTTVATADAACFSVMDWMKRWTCTLKLPIDSDNLIDVSCNRRAVLYCEVQAVWFLVNACILWHCMHTYIYTLHCIYLYMYVLQYSNYYLFNTHTYTVQRHTYTYKQCTNTFLYTRRHPYALFTYMHIVYITYLWLLPVFWFCLLLLGTWLHTFFHLSRDQPKLMFAAAL